jgi:hypothetical protein
MGFIYSATIDALAFTTATDVFEVVVAADKGVTVHAMELAQTTDLGDANEEVLRVGLYRGVTSGSTGTALTEVAYDNAGNPAVGAAVVANRGTASTGGTLIDILNWNIRIPTRWIWTPETRPYIGPDDDPFSFRLISAPTDSVTVSGVLIWQEA